MKNIKPSFFPGILCLAITTILLVLPGTAFPTDDWLSKIGFDKWVHIGLFATLVFLWCWGFLSIQPGRVQLKRLFVLIGLLGLGYGIGMEFIQKYFIVNRSFDLGDIAADAAGSVLGVAFSLGRYIKK